VSRPNRRPEIEIIEVRNHMYSVVCSLLLKLPGAEVGLSRLLASSSGLNDFEAVAFDPERSRSSLSSLREFPEDAVPSETGVTVPLRCSLELRPSIRFIMRN
jgi:hypothetical protein